MNFTADSTADFVAKQLDGLASDQLPFAAALALTRTAQQIQIAEVKEMRSVFDSPTPYTLDALFVEPATKVKLEATVKVKDRAGGKAVPAIRWLMAEVDGGQRSAKSFERRLQDLGYLPRGYYVVPGEGAQLDAFGNVSRAQMVQILAYFHALGYEGGYTSFVDARKKQKLWRGTKKKMGYAYFVGRPGGGRLPLGIYQRFNLAGGTAIKPIFIFVRRANYNPIWDFFPVAQRVYEQQFPIQFPAALEEALRTAR